MRVTISSLDTSLSSWLYRKGTRVPRYVWKLLEYSGDGIVWLTLATLLLVPSMVVGYGGGYIPMHEYPRARGDSMHGMNDTHANKTMYSHTSLPYTNVFKYLEGMAGMSHVDDGTGRSLKPILPQLDHTAERVVLALVILGVNLMFGLLLDLCEVGILKALVRRPRPVHNTVANDMHVVVAVDAYSFPSGHSSRVSFIAQLIWALWKQGGGPMALLIPSSENMSTQPNGYIPTSHLLPHITLLAAVTTWALVVALSRCMMGRHYLSDVIAGLLLGVGTMWCVSRGDLWHGDAVGVYRNTYYIVNMYRRMMSAVVT